MNTSLVSVRSVQRLLAIFAILGLLFGPFAKINFASAVGPDTCTVSVFSDTSNDADGNSAVETWTHSAWLQADTLSPDAHWIWSTPEVTDPESTSTVVFTKHFDWNGPVDSAILQIAADNAFQVKLNGTVVSDQLSDTNPHYANAQTFDVSSYIKSGQENDLEITVVNFSWPTTDPHVNPAGLLYKLDVTGSNQFCSVLPTSTISITKAFSGDAPTTPWSFDFTGDLGNFALSNTADSTTTKPLDPGTYDISESVPDGWDAPIITCHVAHSEDIPDTSNITNGKSVTITAGEDVGCIFTNTQTPVDNGGGDTTQAPSCIGENLLQNPSFEDPVADSDSGANPNDAGFWQQLSSIPNWVSTAGFEVWNNMFGGASNGNQNLELAVADPTTISQVIPTVIGDKYKLSYDFAARPGYDASVNNMDVLINGLTVDTVSADGTNDSSNNWGSHYYEFTATATTTTVAFKDSAEGGGVGTLLDNTAVCLTQDNSQPEVKTYRVSGNIWNDEDGNGSNNGTSSEPVLEGIMVTITDGTTTATTTTDGEGNYYFDVPAGTWTITEDQGEGWGITYPNDGFWTVTVGEEQLSQTTQDNSIFQALKDLIIPTAYASVAKGSTGLDFGNKVIPSTPGYSQGSYGSGAYISLSSGGSASGSSTTSVPNVPTGIVLGAATTTIPVGAPNTGAGGTSPLVVHLPTFNAVISQRNTMRRMKHGK